MSDDGGDRRDDEPRRRQAPHYGEYASPEEVAAITGRPVEPTAPRVPSEARSSAPPSVQRPAPRQPVPDPDDAADAAAEPSRRPLWDSSITVGLLAAGAWNAVQTLVDPASFGRAIQGTFEARGFTGDITGGPTAVVGVAIAALLVVLVVGCAVLSLVAHRRRFRLVFWIPLCGAALSIVAAAFGVMIVAASHPELGAFLSR